MPIRTDYANLVEGVLNGDTKQVQNAIDNGVVITGVLDYDDDWNYRGYPDGLASGQGYLYGLYIDRDNTGGYRFGFDIRYEGKSLADVAFDKRFWDA